MCSILVMFTNTQAHAYAEHRADTVSCEHQKYAPHWRCILHIPHCRCILLSRKKVMTCTVDVCIFTFVSNPSIQPNPASHEYFRFGPFFYTSHCNQIRMGRVSLLVIFVLAALVDVSFVCSISFLSQWVWPQQLFCELQQELFVYLCTSTHHANIHRNSAELPWHHNILPFCLFVILTSFCSNVSRVSIQV